MVDIYVGCQLLLMYEFGMRVREAAFFLPFMCDKGTHIEIYEGTKGGRPRQISVETKEQREAIELCKTTVKKLNGSMTNPKYGNSDRQKTKAIMRTYNLMRKFGINKKTFGVTCHGLRHQYACNRYRLYVGVEGPIRGGSTKGLERNEVNTGKMKLSESLGHSRVSILSAYVGAARTTKAMLAYLNTCLTPEKKAELIDKINAHWGKGTATAVACERVVIHLDMPGGNRKTRLTETILSNISKVNDVRVVREVINYFCLGETPVLVKEHEYVDEHDKRYPLSEAAIQEAIKVGYMKHPVTGLVETNFLRKIDCIYNRNDSLWNVVRPVSNKKRVYGQSSGLKWEVPLMNTPQNEAAFEA